MLFWITVVFTIISILIFFTVESYGDNKGNWIQKFIWYFYDEFKFVTGFVAFISIFTIAVMIMIVIGGNISASSDYEKYYQRYNGIIYKAKNDACRNEFGLLSKDVIDEIQTFNEDLAFHKKIQRDFWVGIFYPNIYDDFEIIEYDNYIK